MILSPFPPGWEMFPCLSVSHAAHLHPRILCINSILYRASERALDNAEGGQVHAGWPGLRQGEGLPALARQGHRYRLK